jgi:hypothetical protein
MRKKMRVNMSIDPELHRRVLFHAKNVHYTDFSGLVTKLLVAELRDNNWPREEFQTKNHADGTTA